jgi:bifunctional UDP-N-acetylglucosamine pyrophosphorylase/glucosamine-1-phosphate N-acetyltransferase
MADGTSRRDHSEVGSAYVHFNFTPNQDKATLSLIGDVPGGVMLNQKPIFLGGQGGLAGSVRIGYGTVIATGSIYRKDFFKGDGLLFSQATVKKQRPHYPGLYPSIKKIITNIVAMRRWYIDVRSLFFRNTRIEKALYGGALERLEMVISERIKKLRQVAEKMPQSIEINKRAMKEKPPRGNCSLEGSSTNNGPR